mgnify:CR=1 FL=1
MKHLAPALGDSIVSRKLSRRRLLGGLGAGAAGLALPTWLGAAASEREFKLAAFSADVTVPVGHGMMGGAWLSKRVLDPLEAHGIVLMQGDRRAVWVSVDWCEIRNEAYTQWQTSLARAVGTDPANVCITTVHQHDAPVADLEAERILRRRNLSATVCDLDFHKQAVDRVLFAARNSLKLARRVTHIGMGQAAVEKVASNRRYQMPDGSIRFDRTSSTRNAFAIEADGGLIDPFLKTLSFWNGSQALAALSFYAVHPMSYYGQGDVSADFPGLARRKRQLETPETRQIYCSGCSGNVTAGKYNNGTPENRVLLADRLHAAMTAAWRRTQKRPVTGFTFRTTPVAFVPRTGEGFSVEELETKLDREQKPFQLCLTAMALSWRRRLAHGSPIQIPAIDFGPATLLLCPGEAYVEFQLAAQRMAPEKFVCVAGYGDGATGYIPTEQHLKEKDSNLGDWCWVAPGAEAILLEAMRRSMGR